MKAMNFAKIASTIGLTALCAWGLVACGGGASSSNGTTGGVAATVNGTEIAEDKVTTAVQSIRSQMSLETEDTWGAWLAENSYTPEKVREEIIGSYVDQELVKQGAAEKEITADSATVDSYVNTMKSYYDTDEAWQEALSSASMTEDEYRSNIEYSLVSNSLQESFASEEEPTEEELVTYSQMYASMFNGAKKSSHILFDATDEATAQSVLDQINAGELDFAAAAQQYSKDSSASSGGNVGWDKLSSFVTEYQTALDGLEKDQVSGLVTSTHGIHIIKCTEVWTAPETITASSQLPSEFLDSIKSYISSSKQSEAYQTWLTEYKESADIVINDMPEGLPYDLDMSKYESAVAEDTAATDGTISTGGETVTNEDGSTTVTNSDGSTVTTYADGSTKTVNADGTSVEVDAAGNTKNYDADGKLVSETTAESSEGSSTASQPAEAA